MSDDKTKTTQKSQDVSRRDFVRTGAKAAYVVPLVLAGLTAAERPAHAGSPLKRIARMTVDAGGGAGG